MERCLQWRLSGGRCGFPASDSQQAWDMKPEFEEGVAKCLAVWFECNEAQAGVPYVCV